MLWLTKWLLLTVVFAGFGATGAKGDESPCPHIQIQSERELNLTSTEKQLICGSSKINSWSVIPLNQAQLFLKSFLQKRGFYQPAFRVEQGNLFVNVGAPTRISFIRVMNAPVDFEADRFWEPIGKTLNPSHLNQIENWAKRKLSFHGYPCGTVQLRADPVTGEVVVNVSPRERWAIQRIDTDPIPKLLDEIPRRYDPFEIGDSYNGMLLDLSAQRLMADDLVVTSHFIPECELQGKQTVRQSNLAGEPRLISFGFGFDTEEYFIAQALWKNSRLFSNASLLSFSALTSYHLQEVAGVFHWYYLPYVSRHHLRNTLSFERQSERRFESRNVTFRSLPTWTVLAPGGDLHLGTGVSYRYILTVRGEGPKDTRVIAWDMDVDYMSYPFEYYRASPRTGHDVQVRASSAQKAFGSDISANRWSVNFTKLFNLLDYDPPKYVLGFRGEFATTQPHDTDRSLLPPSFKYFLGGSSDLRGFGRKAIPPSDAGALTKAYLGVEFRDNHLLPWKLQPLVFADAGWLGLRSQWLDPTLYWSPGVGLRWESPIGAIRTTFAHGLVEGELKAPLSYLSRWQFYFSLGEQF